MPKGVVPSLTSAATWERLRRTCVTAQACPACFPISCSGNSLSLGDADRNQGTNHRSVSRGLTACELEYAIRKSSSIAIGRITDDYPLHSLTDQDWLESGPTLLIQAHRPWYLGTLPLVVLYSGRSWSTSARQGSSRSSCRFSLSPFDAAGDAHVNLLQLVNSGILMPPWTHSECAC